MVTTDQLLEFSKKKLSGRAMSTCPLRMTIKNMREKHKGTIPKCYKTHSDIRSQIRLKIFLEYLDENKISVSLEMIDHCLSQLYPKPSRWSKYLIPGIINLCIALVSGVLIPHLSSGRNLTSSIYLGSIIMFLVGSAMIISAPVDIFWSLICKNKIRLIDTLETYKLYRLDKQAKMRSKKLLSSKSSKRRNYEHE